MSKKIIKRQAEICPKCGNEHTAFIRRDIDMGYGPDQMEREYLFVDRKCELCGEEFTDCFALEYDGYCTDGGNYDNNGEKYTL